VAVLRGASPPNNVRELAGARGGSVVRDGWPEDDHDASTLAAEVRASARAAVRWPPLLDRRTLVGALLAADGSSIVVVADAARGRGLVQWLTRAGVRAVLAHSDLPAAERTRAWAAAAAGRIVVVGGRIAALSPVPDLACAIVVDDADEALQEERTPT